MVLWYKARCCSCSIKQTACCYVRVYVCFFFYIYPYLTPLSHFVNSLQTWAYISVTYQLVYHKENENISLRFCKIYCISQPISICICMGCQSFTHIQTQTHHSLHALLPFILLGVVCRWRCWCISSSQTFSDSDDPSKSKRCQTKYTRDEPAIIINTNTHLSPPKHFEVIK